MNPNQPALAPPHQHHELPFAPLSEHQPPFYATMVHQHHQQPASATMYGLPPPPPHQLQQPQLVQLPPGMVLTQQHQHDQHQQHHPQPAMYGAPPPGFMLMTASAYDQQHPPVPHMMPLQQPLQHQGGVFQPPHQRPAQAQAPRAGGRRQQAPPLRGGQSPDGPDGGGGGNGGSRGRRELVVPPPAPGDTEPGPRQLIVNYIAVDMTSEELRELFEPFGDVEVARVVDEPNAGHNRGFGFVYFRSCVDAAASIEGLSGRVLRGKRLRVSYAIPQRPIASELRQHPQGSTSTAAKKSVTPQLNDSEPMPQPEAPTAAVAATSHGKNNNNNNNTDNNNNGDDADDDFDDADDEKRKVSLGSVASSNTTGYVATPLLPGAAA